MHFHPHKFEKPAALLTLFIVTGLPLYAQSKPSDGQASASEIRPSPTNGSGKLAFDVASVRLNTPESDLKGVDFLNPASDAGPPPGGLLSWNVQIPWLINFAYDLRSSQMRRSAREALPKWAQDDPFTIEARAEGNPSRDDLREMVRSLLKERFQLDAHMG